jgi:ABC-2 type transport system permease protein
MNSILAILRASWLSATSYRLATLISFVGLLASVVPVYFIANAVEPLARESIRLQGGEYFGFVIVGIAATYVLMSAASAIPSVLVASIGSGTFESLIVTRTSLPVLLIGMAAYPLLQSLLSASLLLVGAAVIGVKVAWVMLPAVLVILLMMIAAYGAIGLVAASLVLAFRTSGPLITAVVAGSGLLGGVYYSTSVIPGWLQSLSNVIPLTYALRAIRMLLLGHAALGDVWKDVAVLGFMSLLGLTLGSLAFGVALRHARRAGTLSQY